MKAIVLDKIASVTLSCNLKREVRISSHIPAEEGVVIAVRVLTDKHTYNQLELPSGRMARVKSGDLIAGALGHRRALFGYSGHLPEHLQPGDIVQLLNLGGVIGICDGINPDLGPPFQCEVLGAVLDFPYLGERIGITARIGGSGLTPDAPLRMHGVPVVAIVGSCMNAGKTAAACALVRQFSRAGLVVDAFKATGVSLRRDILAMEDVGARHTALFTDLGVVTTTAKTGAPVTRTLLNRMAVARPDILVVELGDGLLGAYGVEAILSDPEIRSAFTAVVLAANDPVAAWGGVRLLREQYGIEPSAVTGPATDNLAGSEIIEQLLHVRALNARTHAEALADHVRAGLALAAGPSGVSGDSASFTPAVSPDGAIGQEG